MRLVPTADELSEATHDGTARRNNARAKGYKHWGPASTSDADILRYDIAGCLGEKLCARAFDLPYNATIGDISSVDLRVVEVRTRIYPGYDLPIRPVDKHLDRPHVLVRVPRDLSYGDIVGWLVGWEAQDRIKQLGIEMTGNCWYVPEPYHSVKSLQDWLWVGAPKHVRPA